MNIENIDLNKLNFSKLIAIGNTKGFIMTTHVDKHRERFTLELLKKALEMGKEKFWINSNHDPSKTPVAKILLNEIRKMDEDNYGIYVETEVYDDETMRKIDSGELKGFSVEFVEK